MNSWLSKSLFLLLGGTLAATSLAQGGASTNPNDSTEMVADDEVAAFLDSMYMLWVSEHDDFSSNRDELNVYNYAADSIPNFHDSVYVARFQRMNDNSPFDFQYNDATKSYVKLYVVRRRKYGSKLLGLAELYYPMFETMLDKYDMPLELKHLAIVESGLNASAKSRVGAMGLWQFMYPTGKMLGLQVTSYVDQRRDPLLATEAACQYLRYLHSMYDNWDLALAAYNAGPGNVNKAIRRAGGGKKTYWEVRPFLPKETRGYVPAFYSVNYMMSYPTEHNIFPRKPDMAYFDYDTVHISEGVTFDQISEVLCVKREIIEKLNPMYKLGIIPNPGPNRTAVLRIPRDKVGVFLTNEVYVYNFVKSPVLQDAEAVEKIRYVHTVTQGEYLSKVCKKYGASYEEVRIWNNLRSTKISPGQKLVVYSTQKVPVEPNKSTLSTNPVATTSSGSTSVAADPNAKYKYHTIQSGDTLWDIAKSNNISLEKLRSLNRGLDEKRLHTGQKIKIGIQGT
jgi:membrane-bound lytic murein transglycosylase D